MDSEFRVEGKRYVPEPGEIVLHVRDYSGGLLEMIVTQHEGTEESLRNKNSALRTRARRRSRCASDIQSQTFFRTREGRFGVVSPNGKHVAPMSSSEGRYILGDTDARPAMKSSQ